MNEEFLKKIEEEEKEKTTAISQLVDELERQRQLSNEMKARLDDLRRFRPQLAEKSISELRMLLNAVKNAPDYSNVPKEIEHTHTWDISERAGHFFTAALLTMFLLGGGGFIFGLVQKNKKAAPEQLELVQMKKIISTQQQKLNYLNKYTQYMSEKNPKSHAGFIEKNPVPENLR